MPVDMDSVEQKVNLLEIMGVNSEPPTILTRSVFVGVTRWNFNSDVQNETCILCADVLPPVAK